MGNNTSLNSTDELNLRIAYLNILQNIIGRMSTYVLAIKTASLTTLTALLAYSASDNVCFHGWIFLIPWAFFVGYHAFFLRLERAFREIYNLTIDKDSLELSDLKINAKKIKDASPAWSEVLSSAPLCIFHLVLLFVIYISYISLG
jgi:hypothetical protein